jgi:hypothetical protein
MVETYLSKEWAWTLLGSKKLEATLREMLENAVCKASQISCLEFLFRLSECSHFSSIIKFLKAVFVRFSRTG